MRTSARPTALLLFDEVELLDVAALAQTLSLAGRQWNFRPFRIHAVAATPGLIQSRSQVGLSGAEALATLPRPEIVLLPGGYGARRAAADPAVVAWLREAAAGAEHRVAVGNGLVLAAAAGLLDGVRVATTPALKELLREAAPLAEACPDELVEDGPWITAATHGAALDAGLALVRRVLGEKQARVVADQLGARWRVPDGAGG